MSISIKVNLISLDDDIYPMNNDIINDSNTIKMMLMDTQNEKNNSINVKTLFTSDILDNLDNYLNLILILDYLECNNLLIETGYKIIDQYDVFDNKIMNIILITPSLAYYALINDKIDIYQLPKYDSSVKITRKEFDKYVTNDVNNKDINKIIKLLNLNVPPLLLFNNSFNIKDIQTYNFLDKILSSLNFDNNGFFHEYAHYENTNVEIKVLFAIFCDLINSSMLKIIFEYTNNYIVLVSMLKHKLVDEIKEIKFQHKNIENPIMNKYISNMLWKQAILLKDDKIVDIIYNIIKDDITKLFNIYIIYACFVNGYLYPLKYLTDDIEAHRVPICYNSIINKNSEDSFINVIRDKDFSNKVLKNLLFLSLNSSAINLSKVIITKLKYENNDLPIKLENIHWDHVTGETLNFIKQYGKEITIHHYFNILLTEGWSDFIKTELEKLDIENKSKLLIILLCLCSKNYSCLEWLITQTTINYCLSLIDTSVVNFEQELKTHNINNIDEWSVDYNIINAHHNDIDIIDIDIRYIENRISEIEIFNFEVNKRNSIIESHHTDNLISSIFYTITLSITSQRFYKNKVIDDFLELCAHNIQTIIKNIYVKRYLEIIFDDRTEIFNSYISNNTINPYIIALANNIKLEL